MAQTDINVGADAIVGLEECTDDHGDFHPIRTAIDSGVIESVFRTVTQAHIDAELVFQLRCRGTDDGVVEIDSLQFSHIIVHLATIGVGPGAFEPHGGFETIEIQGARIGVCDFYCDGHMFSIFG